MSNQRGFSPVQILLVIVALALVGGTGWYVMQAKNKTNSTLDSTSKSGTEPQKTEKKETAKPETDPTADWVEESNTVGIFKFKHPKIWVSTSCDSITLVGANANSVGHCNSEDGGQISIASIEGTVDDQYVLTETEFSNIKKTVLAVDGVQGSRSEGTSKAPPPDGALGGYPEGTKVVQYVFAGKNNRTYVIRYVQLTSYPNSLADFEILITKTLKFSL